MALAEVATAAEVEVGERRWAEWSAMPSHDVALGAAFADGVQRLGRRYHSGEPRRARAVQGAGTAADGVRGLVHAAADRTGPPARAPGRGPGRRARSGPVRRLRGLGDRARRRRVAIRAGWHAGRLRVQRGAVVGPRGRRGMRRHAGTPDEHGRAPRGAHGRLPGELPGPGCRARPGASPAAPTSPTRPQTAPAATESLRCPARPLRLPRSRCRGRCSVRRRARTPRHRARGCSRPGAPGRVDHPDRRGSTGEVVDRYSSAQELDGFTWVRCGDRRAARCESCSREYKGDAWHLLSAGLVGGKGAPESVAAHPTMFVTLTAPSFGPVHGRRQGAPCRARRDKPGLPARPAAVLPAPPRRGRPPARRAAVRRTATTTWATCCGSGMPPSCGAGSPSRSAARSPATPACPVGTSRQLARVSYTKVAEFQARGLIHVHAVMRLDGPHRPRLPAPDRPRRPGARRRHHRRPPAPSASRSIPPATSPVALRLGRAGRHPPDHAGCRSGRHQAGDVHPEHGRRLPVQVPHQVDRGLRPRRRTAASTAPPTPATSAPRPHAVRIIETAEQLVASRAARTTSGWPTGTGPSATGATS